MIGGQSKPMTVTRTLTCFVALTMALPLAACGGGKGEKSGPSPTSKPSSPPPSAPPNFSAQQLKAGLLSSKEVGSKIRQIGIAVEAIQKKQAPMCSLTGAKLPGTPELTIRQFSNPARGKGEVKYAQLIARYPDAQGAAAALEALRKAARKCPGKRHVPPKKVNENFTLFSHNDTWKLSESTVAGWTRVNGFERQEYSASITKENILYFVYDYAALGNVLVSTLYWERAQPSKSPDPIAKRATGILEKQLQKIG